jgi:ssDNA-binding Zn-finger/Zn-ribbon topoisomerase 1
MKTYILPGLIDPLVCPSCHKGAIRDIQGKYGIFYGCTEYPKCSARFTQYDLNQLVDPDPSEPAYGD